VAGLLALVLVALLASCLPIALPGLLRLRGARPGAPVALAEAQLLPIEARVVAARRQAFLRPVQAFLVAPGSVAGLLDAEIDRVVSRAEFRHEEELLRALGLLRGPRDLRSSMLAFQSTALAGFYSPVSDRLYVVGDRRRSIPEGDGSVLVHELTHALQAQHSQLAAATLGINEDQDLLFALGALLEGDALWTEQRDMQLERGLSPPRPDAFSAQFAADERALRAEGVPRWISESLLAQYPRGYALAVALTDAGGTAALDAALQDPPLSSEELLHPERYLQPARRRPLRDLQAEVSRFAPHPTCRLEAQDSFGEIGLRIWAREQGLSAARAAAVADGWDADRAWILACPGGPVVAWLIQFDSVRDAVELEAEPGSGDSVELTQERRGRRVLLSKGVGEAGRRYLLEDLRGRPLRSLAAWLRAHPEVAQRVRQIRSRGD